MHRQKQHENPSQTQPPLATDSVAAQSLYNDIAEVVHSLSLIDKKPSSSFTRRGSIAFTKKPSRKLNTKKNLGSAKDIEELVALREQVETLQKKISEKDELLKSSEISKGELASIQAELDELKLQVAENNFSLKSAKRELSDAKIQLADKQAALEKLQWETIQSNKEAEKRRKELDLIQVEMSSFKQLLEGLVNSSGSSDTDDYIATPYEFDALAYIDADDEAINNVEEATKAYLAAVALAKEKQDEDSIDIAAKARLHLQSYVFRFNAINV